MNPKTKTLEELQEAGFELSTRGNNCMVKRENGRAMIFNRYHTKTGFRYKSIYDGASKFVEHFFRGGE